MIASWAVLRETPRRAARFDVAGAVALALGVGPLLLAVNEAPDWGITSPITLGCLAVGLAGIVVFARIERRVAAPLVPPDFFRSRDATSSMLCSFLTGASYMGGFFLASLLMVNQFDYSLISAVPILSVRPLLFALTSPVGGWLSGRSGSRVAALAGCLTLTGGLLGLAVGAAAESLWVVIMVGFLLQGIGYGLLRPAISTALANSVSEHDLGVAGAAERLTGQLGVAFGITVVATIYSSKTSQFPPAFAAAALFALLAAGSSLLLHPRRSRPSLRLDLEDEASAVVG